jgi:prepilin-type N-terminal cleavage/methylation domain-containing protein
MPRKKPTGFTLAELMIVVAILSLLAAIAIPKFGGMIIKAKEASVKGKLLSLRSALSIYTADTEGIHPSGGVTLGLTPKYIEEIPTISIPTYPAHIAHRYINSNPASLVSTDWPAGLSGYFVWGYDRSTNRIYILCNHPDSKGRTWSTW